MERTKILIVDHHEIFCEGLVRSLGNNPNNEVIGVCHTNTEAIEFTKKSQPDIILMDTEVCQNTGIKGIEYIHKQFPSIHNIVMTHSREDIDLFTAIQAGAKAYISKKTSPQNLVEIINLVIGGHIIISPPMATSLFNKLSTMVNQKGIMGLVDTDHLSKRETEVLNLVAQGLSNKDIANRLSISELTVKVHVRNTMLKLHTHTRLQAALLGSQANTQDIESTE